MTENQAFVSTTGRLAVAGGVLGLGALVTALATEFTMGEDAMSSGAAHVAGWATFIGAALLVTGVVGLAVRYASSLRGAGRLGLIGLGFMSAITAGAMGTLAIVVPDLADRAPAIVNDPPAAIPATFILSGLLSGVCALAVALDLRRSGIAPKAATTLLIVGAVVTMVPLPSRYFLLAIAVGVLSMARDHSRAETPQPAAQIS